MSKKTATIHAHHVFGTPRTSYADVCYRGNRLIYWMENKSESDLLKVARDWAFSKGFTHIKVVE